MTLEEIMAALDADAMDRLTRNGDPELTRLLLEMVVKFYGLGYEQGVHRGARLMSDAVIAGLDATTN